MTRQTQEKLIQKLFEKILAVSKAKGADYADEDVLSNFKIVSSVIKLLKIDAQTPEGYAQLMVILKICRINNLLDKATPAANEPLEDSFLDGINYFILAYLNYKEEAENISNILDEREITVTIPQ